MYALNLYLMNIKIQLAYDFLGESSIIGRLLNISQIWPILAVTLAEFSQSLFTLAMQKNPESLIREVIEFECPICSEIYDEAAKYPMVMCPHQHTCCLACLDNILFFNKDPRQTIPCPICKAKILRKDAQRFRMLNQIRVTAENLRTQGSIIRKDMRRLNEENGSLQEQLRAERQKNQWLIQQLQQSKQSELQLCKRNQLLQAELRIQQQSNKQMSTQLKELHEKYKVLGPVKQTPKLNSCKSSEYIQNTRKTPRQMKEAMGSDNEKQQIKKIEAKKQALKNRFWEQIFQEKRNRIIKNTKSNGQ